MHPYICKYVHACMHAYMHSDFDKLTHAMTSTGCPFSTPVASLGPSPTGSHWSCWQEGWGVHFMIQQAAFHNMPIAFATAKGDNHASYVQLGRELQSALAMCSQIAQVIFKKIGNDMFVIANHEALLQVCIQ